MATIREQILKQAKRRKARIGITIKDPLPALVDCFKKASEYAEIVIIGKPIEGFECIETENLEGEQVKALKEGKVEGLVRGQSDALIFEDVFCQEFGYNRQEMSMVAILTDAFDRTFILGPTSNPEGWTAKQKLLTAEGAVKLLEEFKIKPKIAFLTAVRPGSRGRNFFLDISYESADFCVTECEKKGWQAKNYNIETEKALADEANIIIPPCGAVGNQMYRTYTYIANMSPLAIVHMGVKENIVEHSRNETELLDRFIFATARANINVKK